jgi:hypothetical protein
VVWVFKQLQGGHDSLCTLLDIGEVLSDEDVCVSLSLWTDREADTRDDVDSMGVRCKAGHVGVVGVEVGGGNEARFPGR